MFANLGAHLPAGTRGTATVELPAGATVDELLRCLAIPEELPRLVLVNGVEARPDRPLSAGDVVSVIPPLVGG